MKLVNFLKNTVPGRLTVLLLIALCAFAAWKGNDTGNEPKEIYANIQMIQKGDGFDVVKTEYFDTLDEANRDRIPGIFVTYQDSVYVEKDNTKINMFVTTGILNDEITLKSCLKEDDGRFTVQAESDKTISVKALGEARTVSAPENNESGVCVSLQHNADEPLTAVYAEKSLVSRLGSMKRTSKEFVFADASI